MGGKVRYYATCLTPVTFLVTVCILIPWYGHPEFFLLQTNGLFQHLLCPILWDVIMRVYFDTEDPEQINRYNQVIEGFCLLKSALVPAIWVNMPPEKKWKR